MLEDFLVCSLILYYQVSALDAISNIVVDFLAHKKIFMQCGGVKQLVQLSKSMDSTIRVKAVCALRNLTFLVNDQCKEEILSELTQLTLGSLICGKFSDIICYLECIGCTDMFPLEVNTFVLQILKLVFKSNLCLWFVILLMGL